MVFKPAEILLEDGDELKIGNSTVKIMHTPGHTLGSICIIADETIISGDTLFFENIGRFDFYGGNFETIIKSLHKIADLEGDYKVMPGHGNSTRLSHEREYNIYLK